MSKNYLKIKKFSSNLLLDPVFIAPKLRRTIQIYSKTPIAFRFKWSLAKSIRFPAQTSIKSIKHKIAEIINWRNRRTDFTHTARATTLRTLYSPCQQPDHDKASALHSMTGPLLPFKHFDQSSSAVCSECGPVESTPLALVMWWAFARYFRRFFFQRSPPIRVLSSLLYARLFR